MPYYITLVNFTDQGVRTIKELPHRVAGAHHAIETAGGKIVGWYLTMGQYDAVVISEAPNDEAVAATVLSIARLGNVRTTTLKAFTEEQMAKIVAEIPQE